MRVVLATGNPGKLRELQALLTGRDIDLVTQAELGISPAAETGLTFVENATLKARHAAASSGLPAIADDSGLEVDALGGRPGVHSARYADAGGDSANNIRLLAELVGIPAAQRTARFRCVLVLLRSADDAAPLICDGVWEGRIAAAAAGDNGFGYDPLFLVGDLGLTAAQLSQELKNQLSHRGQALRKLVAAIDQSGLGRRG
jgi:XTP/dITP diphosphohydrolase